MAPWSVKEALGIDFKLKKLGLEINNFVKFRSQKLENLLNIFPGIGEVPPAWTESHRDGFSQNISPRQAPVSKFFTGAYPGGHISHWGLPRLGH